MKEKPNHLNSILNAIAIILAVPLFVLASETSSLAVQPQVAAGGAHTVGLKSDGTVVAVGYNWNGEINVGSWTDIEQVAAGNEHTVGVKSDGTVVAVGDNYNGQLNVGSWTDIEQVAAGGYHTVGLRSDGTVVATGGPDVGGWTDIVQVANGVSHTVGLKSDGTTVAVGENTDGQLNVGSWKNIVQVAAGGHHTVGIKSDGTAVAVGWDYYGQIKVGSWTDIVQVAARSRHTVGLKSDGTVVAMGDNNNGQLNVGSWTDTVQVAAGDRHTVGLKSDGTVKAVGHNNHGQLDVGSWTDIVQVAAGGAHTVGVKSDGTMVAVGWNEYGQINVGSWTDIVHVAACGAHTVGVKSDGSVVAVGYNWNDRINVGSWTDIVQVAVGYFHTVGVKSDGSVVGVGSNDNGQLNVGSWTDIVQVAAGSEEWYWYSYFDHTVGVKSDGSAVGVGSNDNGQLNVGNWTDIVQVAAGGAHTVGVKSDGSVVAVGSNDNGQLNVSNWTDIVQVAARSAHTVGVKSDGSVVAVGLNHYGQINLFDWNLMVEDKNLAYTPVTPCRIVDTRKTSAGIIDASTQRNFRVFGSGGMISDQGGDPDGCLSPAGEPFAAHINMIAVNPTGKGNLQAFPVGAGAGAGLSVNYNTIDTSLANAGTVKTVTGAGPDITVASNFSSAHTVIDVLGYYYPDDGFYYTTVDPCRIVDTRKTSAGIIDDSTQRDFRVYGSVGGQGGNPAGCPSPGDEPLAAHINMVAVGPLGKGNLQAFPVNAGAGAGLSVNYNTIDTNLANAGTVKTVTGSGPDISVATNFSSAHTVIDVLGYYSEEEDLLYTPVMPCRIVDTRKTSAGIIDANSQRDFKVFGAVGGQGGDPDGCPSPGGVPLAAHINIIAVNPTGKGNLQAFPVGAGTGAGLSVNYNSIDTNLANAGTVKAITGTGPDITVASNFSSAHTVIDVLGYYYSAP